MSNDILLKRHDEYDCDGMIYCSGKKKANRIEMHEETLNCTLILNLPCTTIKEVCSSRPRAKIQLLTTTLHTFLEPEILT